MEAARLHRTSKEVERTTTGYLDRCGTLRRSRPLSSSTAKTDTMMQQQGTADNFYQQKQLLPENFVKAAEDKGKVNLRFQDGYDHSYFTMASFADDHVKHAARFLLEGMKP